MCVFIHWLVYVLGRGRGTRRGGAARLLENRPEQDGYFVALSLLGPPGRRAKYVRRRKIGQLRTFGAQFLMNNFLLLVFESLFAACVVVTTDERAPRIAAVQVTIIIHHTEH